MTRRTLAGWLAVGGVLMLSAAPVQARGGLGELGERLGRALEAELGLTHQAVELERAAVALEREQAGAEHGASVLEHAGRQSLLQLDAYRAARAAREQRVRQRARALVKLARGGVARIVLEDLGDGRPSAERLARGRDLRWLVRHDLRELTAYQRAERRVLAERLAAERRLQALSVLATVHDVQGELVTAARSATVPALERAGATRQQLWHGATVGAEDRRRLTELAASQEELRAVRRDGAEGALLRPVRGATVGRFGTYTDPILRLPMVRNGVELAARPDEEVRAPAAGRVVMVAELPGFEQVVVIDHGAQQLSMLGRLWKVTVAEGDALRAGQPIARVAPKALDDGLGTTAYLEVRHGDKPIDPGPRLRWVLGG
jgi:murein DD-endopeptidase MepM/ murein hydrolase activator NlpD